MIKNAVLIVLLMRPGFSFAQDSQQATQQNAQAQQTSTPVVAPIVPPAAEAAVATPAPAPAPSGNKIERVEVTGSHIRRIDTEGVSPVVTVTREQLDKSGANSVADVLRDMTVNSFGSARESSGSNSAGNAEVDLRGLGSDNTLVLLNGQRLPPDAVTGAVDLNLIPMAAVERVEILKDGASAIYGSDALGGVVNIITRKDYSGTQISLTEALPELAGGRQQEVSLVNGINQGRLNVVTVLQYRDNDAVYSKDRFYTDNGYSNIGSPGSYSNTGGSWIADPKCPPSQLKTTPDGTFCTFNYSAYTTELPSLRQMSGMTEANYELNSMIKLNARIGMTQRDVQWAYAPSPGTFTIPGSVANTLGPGGTPLPGVTPGQDLNVEYRLLELGPRDEDIVTKSFNVLLGATLQVSNDWSVDVDVAHNMVWNNASGVTGYALLSGVDGAISSGSFNPFGAAGSRGNLANTRYAPSEETTSQLSSAEVKASGEIFNLPAGPVGVAIGTSATFQRYDDTYDIQTVDGNVFGEAASAPSSGQRDVESAYSEVSIPILKSLEAQVAGRFDHYSDFGDTANPKVGLLWHITPTVLWRGSYGTGFKAPLMQDLYAATASGYPTFIDHVACNAEIKAGGATPDCEPEQYSVTSSGNKNLHQETSKSFNTGVVWEPVNNFNVSFDAFYAELKNVVGIDYGDMTLAESKGVNLSNYGVTVTRDSNGFITSVDAPMQNLSSQQIMGVDLSTMYRFHHVRFSVDHSQFLYFLEEGFPGAGMRNKLGENGRPPWRDAAAIEYLINDQQTLGLLALTTAGQDKADPTQGTIPNYTTYDLNYTYKVNSKTSYSIGIRNIFATTPPLDNSNPEAELNTSLYDQIGRQLVAGYKQGF